MINSIRQTIIICFRAQTIVRKIYHVCECVSNKGLVDLQFQNNILNYSEILQVQKEGQ